MLFLDAGRNYRKYGPAVSTHDLYKFFAITLMVVDHIGFVFFPDQLWWRAIGRFCVPVWLFLAGYARPGTFRHEFLWLGGLLVLTDLYVGEALLPLNILVTILASRAFVAYADTLTQDGAALATLVTIAVVLLPVTSILFEYGSLAFLWGLAGYYFRTMPASRLAPVATWIAWIIFCIVQSIAFKFSPAQIVVMCVGTGAAAWLMTRYRLRSLEGTETAGWGVLIKFIGRNSHYFYALHLMAFLLLRHYLRPPAEAAIRWIQ